MSFQKDIPQIHRHIYPKYVSMGILVEKNEIFEI